MPYEPVGNHVKPPSDRCLFCGESNPLKLQSHHVVPRQLKVIEGKLLDVDPEDYSLQITLCANCHRCVHYVLRPLMSYLRLNLQETDLAQQSQPSEGDNGLYSDVLAVLTELEKETGIVSEPDLREALKRDLKLGLDHDGFPLTADEEASLIIGALLRSGTIYSPRKGFLKRT